MENNLSRHELKILHRRLNEECLLLRSLHKTMRIILQTLHDGYIELGGVFPIFRYRKLKKVIKEVISQNCLEFLSKVSNTATKDKKGSLSGNLRKLREIDGLDNDVLDNKRPLVSGGQPSSKGAQALRKIVKATGFNPEPMEDEDVMTDDNLKRNIHNIRRDLNRMYADFIQASSTFHLLKTIYDETKGRLFLLRYYTLKSHVRAIISETKADTKYII